MKLGTASAAIISLAAITTFCWALRAQPSARAQQTPAASADQPSRSVWDGVYTEEQAKRGEKLNAVQCAGCHTGEAASSLKDDVFRSNWNGQTADALFEMTREKMPEGSPASLSRQEYADILAYVFSANQFPAGKAELESKAEALKQIRIEANKQASKEKLTPK